MAYLLMENQDFNSDSVDYIDKTGKIIKRKESDESDTLDIISNHHTYKLYQLYVQETIIDDDGKESIDDCYTEEGACKAFTFDGAFEVFRFLIGDILRENYKCEKYYISRMKGIEGYEQSRLIVTSTTKNTEDKYKRYIDEFIITQID